MTSNLTLSSLPLFPLGTVLFPQGILPLQIFEVRYLDMISRCHRAGAPFGVVSLSSGNEVIQAGQPQETFHLTGTLATILELDAPQAGLLRIRCQGAQRFRIESSERLPHGLWIANVVRVDDDQSVGIPQDLQTSADALRQLIQNLERDDAEQARMLPQPHRFDDCGWVANRWCELLPLPLKLKQKLMELESPLVRLELVSDFLARAGVAGD